MKSILKYIFIAVAILLFSASCVKKKVSPTTASSSHLSHSANSMMHLQYARWFSVEYHANEKIITVFNPWNGGEVLEQYFVSRNNGSVKPNHFELPLHRMVLLSSPQIGFLSRLNALDSVVAISGGQQVYNHYLQEGIQNGRIVDLGNATEVNAERLIVAQPQVVFKSAFKDILNNDKKLKQANIPIVYTAAWMEATPLARFEWIKFFAAFCDEEQVADSLFNAAAQTYNTLAAGAHQTSEKPSVMQGLPYSGVWYMPGGSSFKAQLFKDAGAYYSWSNDTSAGSLALSVEEVVSKCEHAQVWLDVPVNSIKELLNTEERFVLFDAVKNKRVYSINKRTNQQGANDYWETGIAYPELVLQDYIRIIHPHEKGNDSLYYYQKLE